MTRSFYLFLGAVVLSGAGLTARADTKSPAKDGDTEKRKLSFSLLPKSFQKNPALDFNVLTEMSPEGRKYTPPTASAPAYYIANVDTPESRGFVSVDFSAHAPKPEQVEHLVAQALSSSHYLPASKTTPPPSIVVLVHWGAYSNPAFNGEEAVSGESSMDQGKSAKELLPLVLGSIPKRKAILERAALIGGKKFSEELNDVLNQEAHMLAAEATSDSGRAAAAAGSEGDGLGTSSLMSILDSMSPLTLFMRRDVKTERLVEEVFSDSYYVVVTALDLKSVAAHKPIWLWRTKLSLNSIGVSLAEVAAPLITSGTDYFGRETDKAVLVTKRINREGRVDIGEAKTLEVIDEKSAPTPTPAPEEKK